MQFGDYVLYPIRYIKCSLLLRSIEWRLTITVIDHFIDILPISFIREYWALSFLLEIMHIKNIAFVNYARSGTI